MGVRQSVTAAGLVVSLLAGASTAGAQDTSAAPVTDSAFVAMAASGGLAEVRLGELAQQKGASAQVKQFGRQMVTDHTAANKQLTSAAQSSGMTPPTTLMPKHQKMVDKLSKLSGKEFDTAYMGMMVKDHAEETGLFQQQSKSGQAEALRQLAAQTLPKLQQHLSMAKQVGGKLGVDTTATPAADAHAGHTSTGT
jgi:putative membrane protein